VSLWRALAHPDSWRPRSCSAVRQSFAVDVLERLPVPFGLLRYGVAPDHHKIKSLRVR
jgi:NADPH-dependent glutamate synthase beta subunit-like oxidoreductase